MIFSQNRRLPIVKPFLPFVHCVQLGNHIVLCSKHTMQKEQFTVFMLLNATPGWLSLSRRERGNYFETAIVPLFGKFSNTIKVRMFDSEYFHARYLIC